MNEMTLRDALDALVKNNHCCLSEDGIITNWETDDKIPTLDELNEKRMEVQKEYDAKKYQRDRKSEFPSIPDQLDKIYHSGLTEWKKDIKAVKDKYPKPE